MGEKAKAMEEKEKEKNEKEKALEEKEKALTTAEKEKREKEDKDRQLTKLMAYIEKELMSLPDLNSAESWIARSHILTRCKACKYKPLRLANYTVNVCIVPS